MSRLTLVIGNKNYSSWSWRPWLAMKATGIAFEERLVPLYEEGSKQRLLAFSPAGKVPILIDGDCQVWESLAIIEHLVERFPDAGLWPSETRARAHARAICAEMHAGFSALRAECPMNLWRPARASTLSAQAQADAVRIEAMWSDCRARFGDGGPFLFGRFTAADAMYAPVVSRFLTYGIPAGPAASAYIDAVGQLPAYIAWRDAALRETWVIPAAEPDWPTVLRT